LIVVLLLFAVNGSRKFVEFETRVVNPVGWEMAQIDVDPTTDLKLTFVLKIRNQLELEKKFWEVSNPDSPYYAEYVGLDSIIRDYSPAPENIGVLYSWLISFGLSSFEMTPTRDFLTVHVPVKTAEEMLQVKFSRFYHKELGSVVRSLDPYTLPAIVRETVAFISGINRFPSRGRIVSVEYKPQVSVTPEVIWATFNTNRETGKFSGNLQGVAQFLEQYFDPADLSDFQQHFNIENQPADKVIGPNIPSNPGTEALLDIEYIIATAPKIPTWFWSTGGLHEGQEPFVQWAQDMNSASTVPFVISVSYGDEESSVSKDYTDRLNLEFIKLGVRGISVLFASGDNGVGCITGCVNDPNWPASSPYVTTVGGFFDSGGIKGDSISSGGFSNYYSIPSYQADAVNDYLTTGPSLPPANQYNKSGRAMPDVSSFSESVIVFQNGGEISVGGTSCASPVFAGIISLINDNLLQNGLKTLGFLNPALYKIGATTPGAFLDVTSGKNGNGCCTGFTATKGWDPITGWGGPNYPILKQSFMAFQLQEQ